MAYTPLGKIDTLSNSATKQHLCYHRQIDSTRQHCKLFLGPSKKTKRAYKDSLHGAACIFNPAGPARGTWYKHYGAVRVALRVIGGRTGSKGYFDIMVSELNMVE